MQEALDLLLLLLVLPPPPLTPLFLLLGGLKVSLTRTRIELVEGTEPW